MSDTTIMSVRLTESLSTESFVEQLRLGEKQWYLSSSIKEQTIKEGLIGEGNGQISKTLFAKLVSILTKIFTDNQEVQEQLKNVNDVTFALTKEGFFIYRKNYKGEKQSIQIASLKDIVESKDKISWLRRKLFGTEDPLYSLLKLSLKLNQCVNVDSSLQISKDNIEIIRGIAQATLAQGVVQKETKSTIDLAGRVSAEASVLALDTVGGVVRNIIKITPQYGPNSSQARNLGIISGFLCSLVGLYYAKVGCDMVKQGIQLKEKESQGLGVAFTTSMLLISLAGICWVLSEFIRISAVANSIGNAINPLFLVSSFISGIYYSVFLGITGSFRKKLNSLNMREVLEFLRDQLLVTEEEKQDILFKVNMKYAYLSPEEKEEKIRSKIERLVNYKKVKLERRIGSEGLQKLVRELQGYFDENGKLKDLSLEQEQEAKELISEIKNCNKKRILYNLSWLLVSILGVVASIAYIGCPQGAVIIYILFALSGFASLSLDFYDASTIRSFLGHIGEAFQKLKEAMRKEKSKKESRLASVED